MITKQQIEKEADAYTNEVNGGPFEFRAFVIGSEWATEHMQAENAELRAALSNILRIAERGDVNVQPLLDPIAQYARAALSMEQD